jgi:peptidoglycan/xylan/chitin deacetylase (PgdA/CDA1 family)
MSNGSSGLAIAGLVIGIVIATQVGDFEPVDIDAPDVDSGLDEDVDSGADDDEWDDDADGTPQDVPTEINGGIPGEVMAGAVVSVSGDADVVALTFSSGPDPAYTPQILDILDGHGVPATFCVYGDQAQDVPELIRRIADEGHALCNQGLARDSQFVDDAEIRAEIEGGREAIQAAAPGVAVPFFRDPGGQFGPDVNRLAEAHGHTPLGWSVDPRDWEEPGAAAIVDSVLGEIRPGDIVVLHDGGGDRSDIVAALDTLIIELRDRGYEIVVP